MKLRNLINMIPILGMVIVAASSCDKAKTYDPIGGAGSTFVKITGGGTPAEYEKKSIDFVPTPSIIGVDVQRMVANSSELTKTMTVVIKIDTAMVTAYNRSSGNSFVKIPNAWYTGTAKNPKAGGEDGTFTMTFKPGEFAKDLEILIPNATLLDPSTTYAIGLSIQSVDADGKISASKSKVIGIGAKNAYDGVYSIVSGLVTRYTAPGVPAGDALSGPLGPANPDVFLVTTAAAKCDVTGAAGGVGFTWATGGGIGGIDGLSLAVNPATNLTTMASVLNTTLTNWAGKVNRYDPATRTFYLAFRWNPATTTREYEVVMKYKKARD